MTLSSKQSTEIMGHATVLLLIYVTVQTAASFSAPLMVAASLKMHFTSLFLDVPSPSYENSRRACMPCVESENSDSSWYLQSCGCSSPLQPTFKSCKLGAHYRTLPMDCGSSVVWASKVIQLCQILWLLTTKVGQSAVTFTVKSPGFSCGESVKICSHRLLGRMEISCRVIVKRRNGFPWCNDRDVQQVSAI